MKLINHVSESSPHEVKFSIKFFNIESDITIIVNEKKDEVLFNNNDELEIYVTKSKLMEDLFEGSVFYYEALTLVDEQQLSLRDQKFIKKLKILTVLTCPIQHLVNMYINYSKHKNLRLTDQIYVGLKILLILDGYHPFELRDSLRDLVDLTNLSDNEKRLLSSELNEGYENKSIQRILRSIFDKYTKFHNIFSIPPNVKIYYRNLINIYCRQKD